MAATKVTSAQSGDYLRLLVHFLVASSPDHETILGITGWRWIFYINIPFGILALVLTSATLHLAKQKRDHSIDYLGAALLVTSVTLILLSVSVYGPQEGWTDTRTLGYLFIGLTLATFFIWWEARAKEPIIPLSLFSNHTFSLTSVLGFIIGAGMFRSNCDVASLSPSSKGR